MILGQDISYDEARSLLKELNACIPEGEGSISLDIYFDDSATFRVEINGSRVADGDFFLWRDYRDETDSSPNWESYDKIIDSINEILTKKFKN